MALPNRAPFLPKGVLSTSLSRANRRRRRGAKPRGLGVGTRQPGCLRLAPAPRPDTRARGPSFGPAGNQASSRSHRVLGRTMSSRRSPPRGNPGGFAFYVVADEPAVGAPVFDEDLVGVEPRGKHSRD